MPKLSTREMEAVALLKQGCDIKSYCGKAVHQHMGAAQASLQNQEKSRRAQHA